MSYRVGTTHYNLPQTEASDTRDWFDTNEAFRVIDEALYSANQTAGQATQDIETVKDDVSDLKDADTAMTGRVNGIEGRVAANELKINRLETDVTDGIQDLKDSICAIEEASATAAYRHDNGEFFWYNDTLYKATTNIAVGQQIVPDTNCKTTNITTELLEGASGGVEIDDTVVSTTKVWSSYKTNEELKPKTGDTRYYSGKIQYYTGSAWVDAEIGGGGMPILDYANPLHSFTSGNLSYTTTKTCWLVGSAPVTASTSTTIKVDGTTVGGTNNHVQGEAWVTSGGDVCLKLAAGSTVVVSSATDYLHVFEEA